MPRRLDVSPSLNRTVIGSFPGLPVGSAGSSANAWLAAWGVARRMSERQDLRKALPRLGIRLPKLDQLDDSAELALRSIPWPPALDALVRAGDEAGVLLADDLGRVLGALVATLVLGPQDARAARPDWSEQQWGTWARVREVAIGGGLVSGALGERMVTEASRWLGRHAPEVRLRRPPAPERLVLRGAAAHLTVGGGLAVDSGSTNIKRGLVSGGHLRVAPPASAPPRGRAEEIVAHIADAIGELAGIAEREFTKLTDGVFAPHVSVAIATYVDTMGQPYAGQLGPYAALGDVNFPSALRSAVVDRMGRSVSLRVAHDGAAALDGARADDPEVDAVIVLGTSLGHAVDPLPRNPG